MRMRRPKSDIRAPLLDRLVDAEPFRPHERVPKRTMTLTEYQESVRRDLLWLLNTRTSFPEAGREGRGLTVIDYGIPDFGNYFTASIEDQRRMRSVLKRFLEAFEPRLTGVEIYVTEMQGQYRRLQVTVEGMLVTSTAEREPVSFPLMLDMQQGRYAFDEWSA